MNEFDVDAAMLRQIESKCKRADRLIGSAEDIARGCAMIQRAIRSIDDDNDILEKHFNPRALLHSTFVAHGLNPTNRASVLGAPVEVTTSFADIKRLVQEFKDEIRGVTRAKAEPKPEAERLPAPPDPELLRS